MNGLFRPEWSTLKKLMFLQSASGGSYATITGNPVSFTAKAAPLRQLQVAFSPVQEGSGDPSPDNVRPISGWDSLTVEQTGVNVADNSTIYQGAIGGNTGVITESTKRICTQNFIPVKVGTYTIRTVPELANVVRVYGAANEESFIPSEGDGATWNASGRTITFTADRYIRIMFSYNMGAQTAIAPSDLKYLTVSDFSRSISISIGQTVYGGTLDVLTGVLTVDMANIASYAGETIGEPWISSMDVYSAGATPTTGAQVVYTLATPQTIQLTPQQVSSLLGENNMWSDANGNLTVTYAADPATTPIVGKGKVGQAIIGG